MHDWHYFFHHVPQNLDEGIYRIFDPQWKAEILHWFGREDVVHEQKEEFIKALIDFDDGCGDFYRYRAYFLACEALAHFPDCSLGDAIVEQLLKWSYAYFRQDKRDWKIYPDPLVKTAREALHTTDKKRVIAAFVQLLHTTESRSTLRLAAEVALSEAKPKAIAALVLLLQVTHNESKLWEIIRSLEAIVCGNAIALSEAKPKAIAALVDLMDTTLNKLVCYAAIAALRKIGYGNETAIVALVRFLEINWGDNICLEAAEALLQVDPGNVAAIAALVHMLETTQNPFLLGKAAEYLVQIAPGNVAAIAALCERLETTRDEYFRLRVAASLVKFAPSNAAAIATLVQNLEATRDRNIRLLAAKSLAQTDAYCQKTIDTLLELAQTFYYYEPDDLSQSGDYWYYLPLCLPAIACLEKIDPTHQLALKTLIELIQTSQDKWIVQAATKKLGQVGTGKDAEVAALVELLTSTGDEYTQMCAAISLGQINPGNQMAIATLVRLIENSENSHISWKAAHSLGQIGIGDEIAIATLVQFIQTVQGESQEDILCIANSLRGILKNKPLLPIVTALKDYLGEKVYKKDFYRYEAAYSLIWHCAQNMSYPEFYNAFHA
jgi:HEAT repeat protein